MVWHQKTWINPWLFYLLVFLFKIILVLHFQYFLLQGAVRRLQQVFIKYINFIALSNRWLLLFLSFHTDFYCVFWSMVGVWMQWNLGLQLLCTLGPPIHYKLCVLSILQHALVKNVSFSNSYSYLFHLALSRLLMQFIIQRLSTGAEFMDLIQSKNTAFIFLCRKVK